MYVNVDVEVDEQDVIDNCSTEELLDAIDELDIIKFIESKGYTVTKECSMQSEKEIADAIFHGDVDFSKIVKELKGFSNMPSFINK